MSSFTILTTKQDIHKNDGSNVGAASTKVFGPYTYAEAIEHLKAFAKQNAKSYPHGTYHEREYAQVDKLNGQSRIATRITAEIVRFSSDLSLHS